MVLLPRYLLRLYLPAFLLCVGVCSAVLVMNQFIRLFNLAVLKGISPLWILGCFARLLPYFFSLAIPIAFLVALLLTLGALSEGGEVLALRASGFSFAEILRPYFYLAAALSVLLAYVNHKASPEGYHAFRNSYEEALARVSRLDVEPGTITALGEWKLFAREAERGGGRLGGVYLVQLKGERPGLRVEAPEGTLRLEKGSGVWLTLRDGAMQWPQADASRLLTARFAEYRLKVPVAGALPPNRPQDLQELETARLRERAREPGLDAAHLMEVRTEMAVRTAGAATPFVFFWLACPLGLRLEKHARATGFVLSLALCFGYYGLLAMGIGLGRRHLALSSVAPWLPVACGLAAGAFVWRRNLRA